VSHGCTYGNAMRVTRAWLRLDFPRRWRSLAVLGLLIAVSSATVLTAVASARRGESALQRLGCWPLGRRR
jgi:hypothetical protein